MALIQTKNEDLIKACDKAIYSMSIIFDSIKNNNKDGLFTAKDLEPTPLEHKYDRICVIKAMAERNISEYTLIDNDDFKCLLGFLNK